MMPESNQKQFDFAKDAITQVITLSSGILALSLTFSNQWASGATGKQKILLEVSWIAFLISILAGLLSLLAIAGLAYLSNQSIKAWVLRAPWLVQIIAFIAGLTLFSAFGIRILT
jgi:hypothetical protein